MEEDCAAKPPIPIPASRNSFSPPVAATRRLIQLVEDEISLDTAVAPPDRDHPSRNHLVPARGSNACLYIYHGLPTPIVLDRLSFPLELPHLLFKINARFCGAPGSADCNIRYWRPGVRDRRMESVPFARLRTSGSTTSTLPETIVMQRCHAQVAFLCGRKSGRARPRSWDLGRSGSISRPCRPLDRAADEGGVSAHSRDDPCRGCRAARSRPPRRATRLRIWPLPAATSHRP